MPNKYEDLMDLTHQEVELVVITRIHTTSSASATGNGGQTKRE
ncbi:MULTISPECIES: hypothetical protein [Calothrix]|nr:MULTISPECIES: hypothetical protein [Calothrix]